MSLQLFIFKGTESDPTLSRTVGNSYTLVSDRDSRIDHSVLTS